MKTEVLCVLTNHFWKVHEDIWAPPPTCNVCPVIHWLSGLANKAITPLMSLGTPGRPSGLQALRTLSISSSVICSPPRMYLAAASATHHENEKEVERIRVKSEKVDSPYMSVLIPPGAMQFTVIFLEPKS